MEVIEGEVRVDGFATWYGVVGEAELPGRLPLLVLHGGPGLPHDYLEPLAALAQGRRVIFYDQIGCGRSARPPADHRWSVERMAAEVQKTREAIGLTGPVHVYGQSFGGFLALEHALAGAPIGGLILADTAASMPMAAERLLALRGDDPSPEAQQQFMARHFIGGDGAAPEPLRRAFAGMGGECYGALWGSGVVPSGPLRSWTVVDRLGEITAPTLVFNGADDQLTPECGRDIQRRIPQARFHIFEHSAHLPFFTEPDEHSRVVSAFMLEVESGRS
jgi:pimeloyl-ACP methyl ester carboxylesterase